MPRPSAMDLIKDKNYYPLTGWRRKEGDDDLVWSIPTGDCVNAQFSDVVQRLLNRVYQEGLKDGQERVRSAIRKAMGEKP